MANFGGHILTRAGQNLLAKLAVNSGTLSYSSIKFGDGVLGSTLPTELTALISAKESVEPSRIVQRSADGRWNVTGVLDNAEITVGFYLREWGIFATDPDTSAEVLLLYANAGSTAEYIPAYSGGDTTTHIQKEMTAACVVSGGITVNTTISPDAYILQSEKGQPNGVVGTTALNKANPEQIARYTVMLLSSLTLSAIHANYHLYANTTDNITITIPADPSSENQILPKGTEIIVTNWNTGKVTISVEAGVSFRGINASTTLVIPDRYGTVTLRKISYNTWSVENNTPPSHTHNVTDVSDAVRSKYLVGGFFDYTQYVIPLVEITNTNAALRSYFSGDVSLKHASGFMTPQFVRVMASKKYNTDAPYWSGLSNLQAAESYGVRFVTFLYSGAKYFGIQIYTASSPYDIVDITGVASNWDIITRIGYYNVQTSTVLNEEINSSLEILSQSDANNSAVEFFKTPKIRDNETGALLDILHSGQVNAANGVVGANAYKKALPEQISRRKVEVASSKTLSLGDAGTFQYINGAGDIVITIPLLSSVPFPTDTEIRLFRISGASATVTIAPEAGVDLVVASGSGSFSIPIRCEVILKKVYSNGWIIENIVPLPHTHPFTDLMNAVRSKLFKSLPSYIYKVIPLVCLDNTDAAANSYFSGDILLRRSTGLFSPRQIRLTASKYASSEELIWSVLSSAKNSSEAAGYRFVTFMYSGVKYFGLQLYTANASYDTVELFGECSNWDGIVEISYYNVQTSTVMNEEVNSSLTVLPSSHAYHRAQEFLRIPVVRNNESDTMYEVLYRGNMGTGSGIDSDTVDGKHASDLVLATEKNAANGIPTLGADGKVKPEQISATIQTKTASFTLALTDVGKSTLANSASAMTITIPTNAAVAFPEGVELEFIRYGAGTVTFAGASGVTIRSVDNVKTIDDVNGYAGLKYLGNNVWHLAV